MMTDCVDTVETPVLWCDKKKKQKTRACFESSLFPWVSQLYQSWFCDSELVNLIGLAA